MVGRSILVPADQVDHTQGESVNGSVELPSSATNMSILIADDAGQLVRSINMGPQAGGVVQFKWDGVTNDGEMAPSGRYQVRSGSVVGDESIAYQTLIASKVDSVSLGKQGQGITLNLSGVGQIDLADVKQVM